MKYLRYSGEFVSVQGRIWRAEIWQENDIPFISIGDIDFDADGPIKIEWNEAKKEDVVCGSVATLKVISPGDRTYADLYTVKAGSVRLDVYCGNELYWSGTQDTEFYEEPYSEGSGYTVDLTFGDFGILDRLRWNRSGMMSVRDVVATCVNATGIKGCLINTSNISSRMVGGTEHTALTDMNVYAANFYDEDGEAMTLEEVLEGVLQPLGIKMVQRGGKVWLYDLNGLNEQSQTRGVEWCGDDQVLSTDNVYNDAKVSWSTYVRDGNLMSERCWGMTKCDSNLTALNTLEGQKMGNATYYTYHLSKKVGQWKEEDDAAFTLWVAKEGMHATLVDESVRFFKMVPQMCGIKTEGIVLKYCAWRYNDAVWGGSEVKEHGKVWTDLFEGEYKRKLFEFEKINLAPIETDDKLALRLRMEMLMDARMNFTEAAEDVTYAPEKTRMNAIDKYVNFVYVPVRLKFRPSGTNDVYIWTNRDVVEKPKAEAVTMSKDTYGKWVLYAGNEREKYGYLAYYDAVDREGKGGVGGFVTNRPAINPHTEKLTSYLERAENGQIISYPNMGGKGGELWLEVCNGWVAKDGNKEFAEKMNDRLKTIYSTLQWIAVKMPNLEVRNDVNFDSSLNTDDVEYRGKLNADAREDIEIETICGTSEKGVPTALGAYYDKDGRQIRQIERGGRVATVEELLIGTLYSQYAERHVKLSGECVLLDGGLTAYTERNQGGKKFTCVEDVQDVRMETSEAVYVELSGDEYNAVRDEGI